MDSQQLNKTQSFKYFIIPLLVLSFIAMLYINQDYENRNNDLTTYESYFWDLTLLNNNSGNSNSSFGYYRIDFNYTSFWILAFIIIAISYIMMMILDRLEYTVKGEYNPQIMQQLTNTSWKSNGEKAIINFSSLVGVVTFSLQINDAKIKGTVKYDPITQILTLKNKKQDFTYKIVEFDENKLRVIDLIKDEEINYIKIQ